MYDILYYKREFSVKLPNSPDTRPKDNNIHDIFCDPKVLWSWWLKFTDDEVN